MYPASFEYASPTSLDQAFGDLDRFGEDGKVLAGGQSLIPLMKMRLAAPTGLVDINRVGDLADEIRQGDGVLVIGARVRHKTCERSRVMQGRFATLGETAAQVSDPIVRNSGTVCGSLAHADPQGDWGSALGAMDASVVIRSSAGERTLAVSDFLVGPFTTALEPNEIVTEVRVPDPGPRSGGAYLKLERKIGDFATVGVAVHVSLANGSIRRAGIALTGVGGTNTRATAAEQSLAGSDGGEDAITQAARLAAEACNPRDDVRGSAEYKRNVVRVYTERGLRHALEQARSASEGG